MTRSVFGLAILGSVIAAVTFGASAAKAGSPGSFSVLGPNVPAVAMSEKEMDAVEGTFWSFFIRLNSSIFFDSGPPPSTVDEVFTDGDATATVSISETATSTSVSTVSTCSGTCSSTLVVIQVQ